MSGQGAPDFIVAVNAARGSEEDWKRVLEAEAAGVETDSASALAQERLTARGIRFGGEVKRILAGLGPEYKLATVLWEGFRSRWVIRIQGPEKVTEMPIPTVIVDGVVESGSIDDLERLKNLVLFAAGRADLIFERKR